MHRRLYSCPSAVHLPPYRSKNVRPHLRIPPLDRVRHEITTNFENIKIDPQLINQIQQMRLKMIKESLMVTVQPMGKGSR